jgi:adenosylhomocysteinase
MPAMLDRAVVCNAGRFGNGIGIAHLNNLTRNNIKPRVNEIEVPGGKQMTLFAEMRLRNPGGATGHPRFRMSASFPNRTPTQIDLFANSKNGKYGKKVCFPKTLNKEVAPAPWSSS